MRADRLVAVLLLLQTRGRMTAPHWPRNSRCRCGHRFRVETVGQDRQAGSQPEAPGAGQADGVRRAGVAEPQEHRKPDLEASVEPDLTVPDVAGRHDFAVGVPAKPPPKPGRENSAPAMSSGILT